MQKILGCEGSFEESEIILFGAGFDSTTCYRPGARFGPSALRNESYGIESYSPYQDKDVLDYLICDSGDLELPFGDPKPALALITKRIEKIAENKKFPFMIGGEHLITLGAIKALIKFYPDLSIIHFDAHADLRDEYLGRKLSHACVMHRCHELVGDGKIFQFGIRSGEKEEFLWGQDHVSTRRFNFHGLREVVAELGDRPVYFTLDLDILDPSIFPGTGTPEAGGVSFNELRKAISLVSKCNLVGADMNELSPHYDPSGVSTIVANKILREMLLYFLE
ncbi:agmatinase [Clostridia bacterium]|nr:agmatinase [Clostridia bacterium]